MNCFPCFSSKKEDSEEDEQQLPVAQAKEAGDPLLPPQPPAPSASAGESENIEARAFTFRELATATKNFRKECLVHDGGFGRVFKGTLQSSGQVMAIKQLNRNGMKGATEFIADVSTLCALKHPNLVSVIGYCADGEQRILVYEYMPLGCLESHLLDRPADKSPLDWVTRMKIASGAAEGLEYLHEKAKPPVIYGDFKSSKILLDEEYAPRLCDYGLAKLTDSGSTATVPARVMGTYGYSAPEYARTGELTLKSDIYSFGVVLLELITGRRAIDPNRPANEQNLVTWAQPIFRDPKRFPEMADPLLNNEFSVKSLNQVVGVAAMCLQEEPSVRPYITDVLAALSFLDFSSNDTPTPSPSMDKESEKDAADDGDRSDHESDSSSSRDSDENENDNNENDSVANDNDEKDDNRSDKSSDHEDNGADTFSDHEDNADKNEIQENQRGSSSDHNDDDNGDNNNELHDDKSGSSTDHEDNAALTIELDNKNSSSDSEDEDYVDDDEIQQKSPSKSIKSTNSKKGKAIELSDDESLYSSGSSRSSSSSINDELGEKKTTQKVKSQRKNSVGKSSSKKSKNRWRRAKVAINHETKS